jgi:hypothetical protein
MVASGFFIELRGYSSFATSRGGSFPNLAAPWEEVTREKKCPYHRGIIDHPLHSSESNPQVFTARKQS